MRSCSRRSSVSPSWPVWPGPCLGSKKPGAWLICAALAGTIAILCSGTRIIWLAILISGIAVLLINRQKLKNMNSGRLLLIVGAAGIVIAVFGYGNISERADFLFATGIPSPRTATTRQLWDCALRFGISASPHSAKCRFLDMGWERPRF